MDQRPQYFYMYRNGSNPDWCHYYGVTSSNPNFKGERGHVLVGFTPDSEAFEALKRSCSTNSHMQQWLSCGRNFPMLSERY